MVHLKKSDKISVLRGGISDEKEISILTANQVYDTLRKKYDITLIEVMPMGDIGSENRFNQYLPLSDVKERLSKKFNLTNIPKKTGGPARYYKIEGKKIDLGFITPLTHNFCESCNRVRLTCTGILYMCLGQDDNVDLKNILSNILKISAYINYD